MAHADSPPFLLPDPEQVSAQAWHKQNLEDVKPLPAVIDDWDYATALRLRRELSIDATGIKEAICSGEETRFGVLVSAESSSTRIRRVLRQLRIPENGAINLDVPVSPDALGGTIEIVTSILVDRPDPLSHLAPTRPGSILWTDSVRVVLEADAARLPIGVVSFEEAGYPPHAPWLIEVDASDLDAPASSCVQVFINSAHSAAVEMASVPDQTSATRILADTLEFQIARRLLQVALGEADLIPDEKFATGSLGESLIHLIQVHFPLTSHGSLQSEYEAEPEIVEAALQSSLRIFAP